MIRVTRFRRRVYLVQLPRADHVHAAIERAVGFILLNLVAATPFLIFWSY